jgi:hypothetical protein
MRAVIAVEAAHAAVVHAAEASTQEATVAWESTVALVRNAEYWADLVEREAWERVSRFEAKSITTLASTHREAEGFARRIALLKGELAEAR